MAKKTKITKEELKQPDSFVSATDKLAAWLQKNKKIVLGATVIVVGGALAQITSTKYISAQRVKAEAKLYTVKSKITQKVEQIEKTKKPTKDATPAAKTPEVFEANFKVLSDEYVTAIKATNEAPSVEHALSHSQFLADYGQLDAAIELLQSKSDANSNLLSSLLNLKLGTLLANKNSFDEAINHFDKVLANKKNSSLHADVYLKKALCLEKSGKIEEAKAAYEKIKTDFAESAEAKSATTYLRLLEVKGNS